MARKRKLSGKEIKQKEEHVMSRHVSEKGAVNWKNQTFFPIHWKKRDVTKLVNQFINEYRAYQKNKPNKILDVSGDKGNRLVRMKVGWGGVPEVEGYFHGGTFHTVYVPHDKIHKIKGYKNQQALIESYKLEHGANAPLTLEKLRNYKEEISQYIRFEDIEEYSRKHKQDVREMYKKEHGKYPTNKEFGQYRAKPHPRKSLTGILEREFSKRRIGAIFLFLLGIFLIVNSLGITGFSILGNLSARTGSVLGLAFVIGGIGLFMFGKSS